MRQGRRVWGYRLAGREVAAIPLRVQAHFAEIARQLAERDLAPDDVWNVIGHQMWLYTVTSGGVTYRMAVEIMPEGWVMRWAHAPAAIFRRRLERRLIRLG